MRRNVVNCAGWKGEKRPNFSIIETDIISLTLIMSLHKK